MLNLVLISLMIRNDRVFQPSHNSFEEPKGKRRDVRHMLVQMPKYHWNGLYMLEKNSCDLLHTAEGVFPELFSVKPDTCTLCLGYWAVNGELSNSAFRISDSHDRMVEALFSCRV